MSNQNNSTYIIPQSIDESCDIGKEIRVGIIGLELFDESLVPIDIIRYLGGLADVVVLPKEFMLVSAEVLEDHRTEVGPVSG